MGKFKMLVAMMLVVVSLTGCIPKCTHEPDPYLGDEGHLTQLLEDLKKPGMKPVYDEEVGHWVAVPAED